ncbi:MAG: ABC transporter substrate-binding protein [Pseudomonadota bacterium]|nr:ABC transporter substrate-binding protein [Pseudomonadota bacterium]
MSKLSISFAGVLAALSILPVSAQDRTGVTDTTIKIGVPAPLTGPNASFGAAAYGIQAYYNYINEKGGIHGRKIEVILGDHACNEAKGVAVAKKLIHQDKVFILNGGICSGVALAMKPVILEEGVPWVVSTAVNQNISTPNEKTIFHASQTSRDAGINMAKFALSKPGTAKIGIVAHTNEWAKGYRDPLVDHLKSVGITPAVEVTLERGQSDATAQVLKLKEANPDFVAVILYEPELAVFLRDAHKYGLQSMMIGALGADYTNTERRLGSREPMLRYYQVFQYKDLMDGPGIKKAREIIEPRLPPGEKVTDFTFYGPGSAVAVAYVLEKVGRDLTREKFIDEMNKLKDFDTGIMAGKLSFSPDNHQGASQLYVIGYEDGQKLSVLESWGKKAQ